MSVGSVALVGASEVSASFANGARLSDSVVNKLVRHHGHLLATKVKAKASGRPGPNAPTGDYRRSITLIVSKQGDTVTAYVGTNAPQGRRLEFGFHGLDSLGRQYNQAPLPHFGPALDEIKPGFLSAIEKELDKL